MMMIGAWTAEALIYLCFSFLVGGLIVYIVPKHMLPDVLMPKWVMILSVIGIAVFSFIPILRIILFFSEDLGFWLTFKSVLLTFEEGKAYLLTLALSLILVLLLYWGDVHNDPLVSFFGAAIAFVMILALGWASHASSLYGWKGFFAHTAHFLAVTVWCGVLLGIGWFAKNHNHWREFLSWFTPVSILAVSTIAFSGFVMMQLIVPEYFNSWILSYGQALLVKHLLAIPVVVFALFNSYWMRKMSAARPQFNPLPWFRGESILIVLIFATTGLMAQQTPPHDVSATLNEASPSALFLFFYSGTVKKSFDVTLALNLVSIPLLIAAIIALIVMIITLMRKKQAWIPVTSGLMFVFTSYTAVMTSIQ